MSASKIRDALLTQCDTSSVEAELKMLNAIMQAEDRRSRRLARWTLAVWIGWVVCVTFMFLLPLLLTQSGPPAPPQLQSAFVDAVTIVSTIVILVGAVFLPVIGSVLLVLAVFSRRTTNISQLRASVAAIDAQVKALVAGSGKRD